MGGLRLGLIGAGGIGRMHRDAIAVMEAAGCATLAAVVDTSPQVLAGMKNHSDGPTARFFSDYRQMLDETALDAVIIASPIPWHFEMTREVLHRKLPLLLEKPPFPLIQQLDAICALPGSDQVAVFFQWNCSIPARSMKQCIAEGGIGQLEEIRISGLWPRLSSYYDRSPWAGRMILAGRPVFDGPATNAMAHLIHYAMFLAGQGEEEFYQPEEVWGEFYRARKMESYDFAALRGRFANGTSFTASLGHCEARNIPFQVEARGSLGWIRWDEDGVITDWRGNQQTHRTSPLSLFVDCYHDFLGFCRGEAARPRSRLVDTRGYVLATNAGLMSSGGIHIVTSSSVSVYNDHGDDGVSLEKLDEVIHACRNQGLLPSEQGVSWARAGQAQATAGLSSLRLEDYLAETISLVA